MGMTRSLARWFFALRWWRAAACARDRRGGELVGDGDVLRRERRFYQRAFTLRIRLGLDQYSIGDFDLEYHTDFNFTFAPIYTLILHDLPFHSHNKNIMPLIPFSVPPHMEQPEAPLTAEEREKKIREQIEYYFSENNLCSDVYLKGWMNQQGWVPLTLVAGFPRVQALTTDYETVQRSVLSSTEVELQQC
uniref:La domain containing protein n=1 Tax=Oryza sativa subsp. japonica TaxID=39947 RepID=Q337U4_ORYSJ|nr:La domain containing protein [Oryza sativa Japonica Group]